MKKLCLTISLIVLSNNVFGAFSPAPVVSNITRLTHPAFQIIHVPVGSTRGHDPWNSDNTKIMLFETTLSVYGNPNYNWIQGRRWVWANVQDLITACNSNSCMDNPTQDQLDQWLTDYLAVTTAFPNPNPSPEDNIRWSEISGEEDILYYLLKQGSETRLRVMDTSIDPPSRDANYLVIDSSDAWYYGGYLIGFDVNNKLMVINELDFANAVDEWYNVTITDYTIEDWDKGTKQTGRPETLCPNMSDAEWGYNLWSNHGHSFITPNRLYRLKNYGATNEPFIGVNVKGLCSGGKFDDAWHNDPNADSVAHISATYSNEWWVGGKGRFQQRSVPTVEGKDITHIAYDNAAGTFKHTQIIADGDPGGTTATWWNDGGDSNENSDALPYVNLRDDGGAIMWTSTGGKFSVDDKNTYSGSGSWSWDDEFGNVGLYYATLTASSATSLTITAPDGDTTTQSGNFTIVYTLADVDDVVTVDLYYEADSCTKSGGILVPKVGGENCSSLAEGEGATCAFDTGSITPGTYYIYGITSTGEDNSCSNGTLIINADANNPPTVTVNQPDGVGDSVTEGDGYLIDYDMADGDSVATLDCYWDEDNVGFNGTAIAGCQNQPEGVGATCTWDTTGMGAGDYYVHCNADDGTNPEVKDYSPGQLTISAVASSGASMNADFNGDFQ
jgi:hypothetical protein